jgi:DNA polymerase-4
VKKYLEKAILHSDLNCFYASVETMLNPALRDKAVAVCGQQRTRHGIVLAKSELAKRAGVKTGMVNWEAKRCCPNLIMVAPQYEQYLKYSKLTRAIYERYTDLVEPFGMDECWWTYPAANAFTATDFHSRGNTKDRARGTWNDGEHRRFV